MRRSLVILTFCAAAFLALAPPVRAQEAQPGDACATAEEFIRVGGPENPGSGHFMLCDGATWQPVLNYSSANRWVMFGSAGLAAAPLHLWGEAIIGNQGLVCTTAGEGALRYTSSSDSWEYCDGANWSALASGSGTGMAAGNDREIQFNSGGAFGSANTFKLMADGDLLLTGTYTGTASVPVTGAGTRMFFDVQKGAFRTGRVIGTKWDDASIGNYSIAMGFDTTASGGGSTAMGWSTTASGSNSVAMGIDTTASGNDSTAMGNGSTASGSGSTAMGDGSTASGSYSTAMGKNVNVTATGDGSAGFGLTTTTPATAPKISGAQSFGIFMGNHSGVDFSSANTMGLFGGKLVIDPSVPATNLSADAALEVAGDIQYTGTLTAVSDIRVKYNIEPLDNPLAKLTSLHGLSYDKKSNADSEVTEYGFAAQEVQKVFPELVRTASDEMGTLSVNYIGLIAPMVEALKEQQAQISALEEENKALVRRLEALEDGGDE